MHPASTLAGAAILLASAAPPASASSTADSPHTTRAPATSAGALPTALSAAHSTALPPDTAALRRELEARIARHEGRVHLSLLDPASGRELVAIRGDEPVTSASMIKVPLLVEVYHQVENGKLRLEDPIYLLEADKQPGSGILQHLDAPHQLTVRDAALLMIALSDNTATNLLIDRVGIRPVGDRMQALGLPRTRLHSKTFLRSTSVDMDSSRVYGLGVTTASEFATLLGIIYRGEAVSPAASEAMVGMLRRQLSAEGIPRGLTGTARAAHKTGALSDTRHDCGIIYSDDGDYVLCILTTENADRGWGVDAEPYVLTADLTRIVHRHMSGGG